MDNPGNIFAVLALFLWIPVALWGSRRWPPAKATILLLVGAMLFLPEGVYFKLPGLPEVSKQEISILWIFVGALAFNQQRFRTISLTRGLKFSIALLIGGAVITILTNSDPVTAGSVFLPGHRPYDAVHHIIYDSLVYVVPFVLGAAMFQTPKDLRVLYRVIVGAALIYSVLQLIELRFSPQLHYGVYGFYQHSFAQTMRGGGFRPMVFMSHGLALAMFTATAVFGAAAMQKTKMKVGRWPASWALWYLWVLLFVSKSIAAFMYSVVAVPLIFFTTPKTQLRVAMGLAVIVLLYPAIRAADLLPVQDIKEVVSAQFGEEKVISVMTRFENEDELMDRARERIMFGWGSYCRGCMFERYSGEMVSIRDGDWIIMMGDWGVVGFLGKFGLLLLPIFFLRRRLATIPRASDRRLVSALALIVAFSVVDLLPNGNFNYLVMMLSGALYGSTVGIPRFFALQAQHIRQEAQRKEALMREAQA